MSVSDRFDTLLEQAGELARLLLKSSQPPRALTSEFLHGRKRFTAEEKAVISSLAHHALRCWRPAAAACGRFGEVDPREDAQWAHAVLAASLLLALPERSPLHPALPLPPELFDSTTSTSTIAESAERLLGRAGCGAAAEILQRAQSLEDQFSAAGADAVPAVAMRWSLPGWMITAWREETSRRGNDSERNSPPERTGPDRSAAERAYGLVADSSSSAGGDATRFDTDTIATIGASLMEAAPLTLRTNRLRCTRDALLQRLRDEHTRAEAHPLLPDAVIVGERTPLTEGAAYGEGCFEVQDAGSQVIAMAAAARPGMRVYDTCAGGGGKTMQLAGMMRDEGLLLASDIERNKLRGLRQRAARIGLGALRTVAVTPYGDAQNPEQEPLPEHASFDCVLVDAPCSGAGTVRRNPALKWRLQEKTVHRLALRQHAILLNNAQYVRPGGGTLVYATCSLLPQENAHVIRRFLLDARRAGMDFVGDPLLPAFMRAEFHPPIPPDCWQWSIPPSYLDSDGYFVARMLRRS